MGIKSISLAISALVLSTGANAAMLLNPNGANYTAIDSGSYGITHVMVNITSNGTFTLNFDNYGTIEETVWISLANSTGSDWSSFSITYDADVSSYYSATLGILETGSGNPAVISTFFTDPDYGAPIGFEADFIGGESLSVAVNGSMFDPTGLHTLMPMTITTSAVPVPAAVWLFGSGLLGLIGVARRKKS